MTIALDTNIFIYVLSSNEAFCRPAFTLLKRIETEDIRGVASTICFSEVLAGIRPSRSEDSLSAQLLMEGLQHLDYVSLDIEIALLAGRLRADYGPTLRMPDAIHLATAISQHADEFITNDQKLIQLPLKDVKIRLLTES